MASQVQAAGLATTPQVAGTQCKVVAPSSIPKRSGDCAKTDRCDAMMSLKTAIQHAASSESFWHMAQTTALQQALSNAWLKAQSLVSAKELWCKAQS